MNAVRGTAAVIAAALLCLAPGMAQSTTLGLSWDSCTGPLSVDIQPPTGTVRLMVSAIGQTEPHGGYDFRFAVADQHGDVPDCWQFEDSGCQTGNQLLILPSHPGFAAACPAFSGPGTVTVLERSFTRGGIPEISPYAGVLRLRAAYPLRTTLQPAQREQVGYVLFDHTYSVYGASNIGIDCGGLERGVCLALLPGHSTWVAADGSHVPFAIGNGLVTANGGSCGAVPAASATWGLIKSQYRR